MAPLPTYFVGLDLGQSKDYTALAVLERRLVPLPEPSREWVPTYAVRHLRRWTLGTKYTVIVQDVAALVMTPPLDNPTLAVDQTGVGRAVVDVIRDAQLRAVLCPVCITGGTVVTHGDDGACHVPKKELVSTLQVLLQNQRLAIANLPERETLVRELSHFKVKITAAGNESFEAWRERDHDDLVLAVAMAAWMGERSDGAEGADMAFALGRPAGAMRYII